MNPISPSTSIPSVKLDSLPRATPQPSRAGETSFQGVVEGLVNKINSPHLEAEAELAKLASGQSDNVHSAVLSMVKADMSFRMALEVRNRLTEAYQEIMRMQI